MAARRPRPKLLIITGPNGAGKTTFAREFLPHEAGCPDFINADLIAQGLSPFLLTMPPSPRDG
jgi:predicted ABC-type ATPase